ncbi:hypothetical protein JYP52_23400, partial [Nitratireductor aquibiodomus]|uniref:hypothetical protein n=1 Tax=Nitratireductor aquibiodomus TaxID=204799 RepID=UPI0019D3BACC
ICRSARSRAPRQTPSIAPATSAKPTARVSVKLDKTWGQRQLQLQDLPLDSLFCRFLRELSFSLYIKTFDYSFFEGSDDPLLFSFFIVLCRRK